MFSFFEKDDEQIQIDVLKELKFDPSVTSTQISVTAKNGVVTLNGNVPHFFEKTLAEEAAQRVGGVRAVADEIEVKLMGAYEKSDADIANAALNAVEWNFSVPRDVKVSVDNGWITLRGEAEWDYQRQAARKAVTSLMGVKGVRNEMTIKARAEATDVQKRIEAAFRRSAETEGKKISVHVDGNKVTLAGKVHSFSDLTDAAMAAWNTPGVGQVVNNLRIS
jgi:osmotically-inducible protein OsmY